MASAADTIEALVEAYLDGDDRTFEGLLSDDFRGHGSEGGEHWNNGKRAAMGTHLGQELGQRKNNAQKDKKPHGKLVNCARNPKKGTLVQSGDLAYFTCEGGVSIYDDQAGEWATFDDTSWTVILRNEGGKSGDWKVALSHFSILRSGSHPAG